MVIAVNVMFLLTEVSMPKQLCNTTGTQVHAKSTFSPDGNVHCGTFDVLTR